MLSDSYGTIAVGNWQLDGDRLGEFAPCLMISLEASIFWRESWVIPPVFWE